MGLRKDNRSAGPHSGSYYQTLARTALLSYIGELEKHCGECAIRAGRILAAYNAQDPDTLRSVYRMVDAEITANNGPDLDGPKGE